MKPDLTEIVFVLDRSISTRHRVKSRIDGYNSFLAAQKDVAGDAQLTTAVLTDAFEVLHDGVNLRAVQPVVDKDHFAKDCTALLDAIGTTIQAVGSRLDQTPEAERPSKVLFAVVTDGPEKASQQFTYEQICEMVCHQQEKYSWEFLFCGANMDALTEARNMGIQQERAVGYIPTVAGTKALYGALGRFVSDFRTEGEVAADWSRPLQQQKK